MAHKSAAQISVERELELIAAERVTRRKTLLAVVFGLASLGVFLALILLVPVRLGRTPTGLAPGAQTTVSITSVAGVDDAAWDKVIRLEGANDQTGLNQLVGTGRGFVLDEGTSVLVLETSFTRVRVRALAGRNADREGWVHFGNLIN